MQHNNNGEAMMVNVEMRSSGGGPTGLMTRGLATAAVLTLLEFELAHAAKHMPRDGVTIIIRMAS